MVALPEMTLTYVIAVWETAGIFAAFIQCIPKYKLECFRISLTRIQERKHAAHKIGNKEFC